MIDKIRNIGTIAHIDAGKTTTTERMIYYAGKSHKLGSVDEGTTVTDFDPEEARRGITIYSATTRLSWDGHTINLIDTPGHVDFTAEVERSLRVLDGAVVVFDGVAGVQPQSETVWRQANRYGVSRLCFVNKLDRTGADFHRAIGTIEKRLGAKVVPIQLPIGLEGDFAGIVDLIGQRSLRFEGDDGRDVVAGPVPPAMMDEVAMYREQLLEKLAEVDLVFMELFLAGGGGDEAAIHAALRRCVISHALYPVLCGSALKNKGVQCVLDAVVRYFPSPAEVPPAKAIHAGTDKTTAIAPDPDADPVVYAFKTKSDLNGEVTFLRVYAGTITNGMQLYNVRAARPERITNLSILHGAKVENLAQALPGQIAAVRGLRYTVTGDTLALKKKPLLLERLAFPETVVSMSIEPKTSADKKKLDDVLAKLAKDDPTFKCMTDAETGQLIVSGMGELHLEVIKARMLGDFNLDCSVGRPRVSYRETILREGVGEAVVDRKLGETTQYARVKLVLEPAPKVKELAFINRMPSAGPLLDRYKLVIQESAMSAASTGMLAGYPMIRMKVALLDAEQRDEESDAAFASAASIAVRHALEQAGESLLEPIMKLAVETPESGLGDVLGDLQSRRAEIRDVHVEGELRTVVALVPISELFGYANHLRSLTQGRGSCSMEPHDFVEVPTTIAKRHEL